MTIIHKVPVLRITRCSDFMLWYRSLVGQFVPHCGWSEGDGYKSRESSGYINFVRESDCEVTHVHVATDQLAHWPFNHYLHLANGVRKTILLAERPSGAWPHIVKDIGKAPTGSPDEPAPCQAKGQTRAQSLTESATNIGIGWLLSLGVTAVVLPMFGHQVTLSENAAMTTIFTVISLVRSYAVRRYFNHIHSQKL